MPVYEYRCRNCDRKTSKLWRNYSPPDAIECTACGSTETNRVISSVAFHKSISTQLADLDPKYDKMVDAAAASTADNDPNRFLRKATPLSEASN